MHEGAQELDLGECAWSRCKAAQGSIQWLGHESCSHLREVLLREERVHHPYGVPWSTKAGKDTLGALESLVLGLA